MFCISLLGCHNKIPQTGWLKHRKLISHSSRGWKSKIKVDCFLRPYVQHKDSRHPTECSYDFFVFTQEGGREGEGARVLCYLL